ncbi:hypothetical protein XPN_4227, partial [Xanthomonas arboricola pv. pruni MAFF 301427]
GGAGGGSAIAAGACRQRDRQAQLHRDPGHRAGAGTAGDRGAGRCGQRGDRTGRSGHRSGAVVRHAYPPRPAARHGQGGRALRGAAGDGAGAAGGRNRRQHRCAGSL